MIYATLFSLFVILFLIQTFVQEYLSNLYMDGIESHFMKRIEDYQYSTVLSIIRSSSPRIQILEILTRLIDVCYILLVTIGILTYLYKHNLI